MITEIQTDLVNAMKKQDAFTLAVLRGLKAALTDATKVKGKEDLSDLDVINIVRKQIKQRQDSMLAYAQASRIDLRDKESAEVDILSKYLPKELTNEELDDMIVSTMTLLAATSKKDMGRLIKSVVEQSAGRADGKRISTRVGELLP